MARLITAQLLFVSALALCGCFLSHEAPGPHPTPTHDASVPIDAAPPDLGTWISPPARCGLGSGAITVHVEGALGSAPACLATHVDDVRVRRVTADPASSGIRIDADYCPSAGDEGCPCTITVSGVGAAPVTAIVPGDYVLDIATGETAAPFVSLRTSAVLLCDCPTCPCSLSSVFYAADTIVERAAAVPPELGFSVGDMICTTGRCPMRISALHARVQARETDVSTDHDVITGSMHLHVVRDPQTTCDPCPTCGGSAIMGPANAAWAAWRETEIALPD